ncbi:hypothetical protein B296_00045442 [Ensete ventricosum]|uniref:Uncharacterized protein n=1 Tax=Ensete ventricosum TaxID=4639 RepID=A0A426YVW6_ENSVE|nr:hypothetical protein B296_00045442 [Ensete ventricosum]
MGGPCAPAFISHAIAAAASDSQRLQHFHIPCGKQQFRDQVVCGMRSKEGGFVMLLLRSLSEGSDLASVLMETWAWRETKSINTTKNRALASAISAAVLSIAALQPERTRIYKMAQDHCFTDLTSDSIIQYKSPVFRIRTDMIDHISS